MSEEIRLSIYLLRPEQVPAFEAELLSGVAPRLELLPPLEGAFIPFPSDAHTPRWVPSIRTVLQQPDAVSLEAQSPGGILAVTRNDNTFVMTFGHAWQRLDDRWLEREFGRRVALNAIARDQLLEIHLEQVFAKWHLADERAPRASSLEEFNVESDRDLVGAIAGVPKGSYSKLGTNIKGGTSLRVTIPLSTLPDALDLSAALFESDDYKKAWPEIDNITPINDNSIISALEAQLEADLRLPQTRKRIVMFTPSYRRGEDIPVDSYVFGRLAKQPAMTPQLTIEGWVSFLARTNTAPSVEEAKESKIHLMDHQKEEIRRCTAFDCFGYETALDGKPFVLSSGQWYEVTTAFLKTINQALAKIPAPALNLPAWNHPNEATYNRAFAQSSGFLLFDARPLHYGGGQSKFEFCDVCDLKTKTLFFVKNPSKSSGMSHLTEQVRRTAELFFSTDDGYRKELGKLFRKANKKKSTSWLNSRPQNGDWELCMVSLGRAANQLPFFAKCGLYRLDRDLTERGHKVTFAKV